MDAMRQAFKVFCANARVCVALPKRPILPRKKATQVPA
jgi:hypothetical protein